VAELYFVEEWPMQGRQRIVEGRTTIGRVDSDIVLPDPDVSRRHALLKSIEGGFAVEDLHSTNGTFVNDERIASAVELHDGDTVRFGNTVWKVCSRGADAGRTHVASEALSGSTQISQAATDDARPAAEQQPSQRSDSMPGAIRASLSARPAPAVQGGFAPPFARSIRGSAARRLEATVISYAVVVATAIAVTVYLIQR
jgi:predicted component of type VI protein secretion system